MRDNQAYFPGRAVPGATEPDDTGGGVPEPARLSFALTLANSSLVWNGFLI